MWYQWACAKAVGDTARARQLYDQLHTQFGTCDTRWRECAEKFVTYFEIKQGQIPYRERVDNELSTKLAARSRIAFVGDWGTGTKEAVELLEQVARKQPDLVIHLGDIYYSGLQSEVSSTFLDICRDVLGDTPVFSLAGNHDMYSGGEGYYWLVDELEQRASYFCIRNEHWQFIAMDTGYHDWNPFAVSDAVTFVNDAEAEWIRAKVTEGTAHGRRTCLLSHHQPFSAFENIGTGFVNDKLLTQLGSVLNNVDLWLWGHEHRLDIYDAYKGVKRGRCLGCSAVPVFVQDGYFTPKLDEIPLRNGDHGPVTLGNNGEIYNLAFALMALEGPNAQVQYFQNSDESTPLFAESIS
jgi:predicted phosphodiesterase